MLKPATHLTALCVITLCGVLACGGSNDSNRPTASGGSTSTGGKSSTGGSTTTPSGGSTTTPSGGSTSPNGGSTSPGGGSGGAGSNLVCSTPVAATVPNITDFSDWKPSVGKWGTAPGPTGSLFSYGGPAMGANPASSSTQMVTDGALHLVQTVQPGSYAGAGLSFDTCMDVTTYAGVSFTINGDLGGCSLEFQGQNFSNKSSAQNGGCDPTVNSCNNFPSAKNLMIPAGGGTITVMFADLMGGGATAFSAMELVGLQWQSTSPSAACTADFTVDDVMFVQ